MKTLLRFVIFIFVIIILVVLFTTRPMEDISEDVSIAEEDSSLDIEIVADEDIVLPIETVETTEEVSVETNQNSNVSEDGSVVLGGDGIPND